MKKNKISLLLLAGVVLLFFIGETFAYATQEVYLRNFFSIKPYSAVAYEKFESPDHWTPGAMTPKEVYAKNTNKGDVIVRVSYTEEWKSKNGRLLPNKLVRKNNQWMFEDKDYSQSIDNALLSQAVNEGDTLEIALKEHKNKYWRYDNGYYYYCDILNKEEETQPFLGAIRFNPAVNANLIGVDKNGQYDAKLYEDDKYIGYQEKKEDGLYTHFKHVVADNSYSGANYTLTAKVETIQAMKSAMCDLWKYDSNAETGSAKELYEKLPDEIDNANHNQLYFSSYNNDLYYDSKLFDDNRFTSHLDASIGDQFRDELIIKNNCKKTYKLYLKAIPISRKYQENKQESLDLLEHITMKVMVDGKTIYNGKVTGKEYAFSNTTLLNTVYIGEYKPEKKSKLEVTMQLDPNYEPPDHKIISRIDWKFWGVEKVVAEEDDNDDSNGNTDTVAQPISPKTGQARAPLLLYCVIGLMVVLLNMRVRKELI